MRKVFVLRTQAIVTSKDSTERFGDDNIIVVPMAVLERVEYYEGLTEQRVLASKFIEKISGFNREELLSKEGVTQKNGSCLRIVDNSSIDPEILKFTNLSELDQRVFQVCLDLQREYSDPVILISQSPTIRLKAERLGIESQEFKDELFPLLQDQYKGVEDIFISQKSLANLKEGIPVEEVYKHEETEWYENMFLNITSETTHVIGRFSEGLIHPISYSQKIPNGYKALNLEQKCFWECLMAPPEIAPLVVCKGVAGTGKTYNALAYAYEHLKRLSDSKSALYDQILIATPAVSVANETYGYLPGEIDSKLGPYFGGIKDNLRAIFREKAPEDSNAALDDRVDDLFDRGFVEIQPIGFLRGRSIPDTCFIIDETQNINPGDILDIVTRAAKGSKFIFLGDPTQVNARGLNPRYNGLVYLSEKMKGQKVCWQVTLNSEKSIRGPLAQIALEIL